MNFLQKIGLALLGDKRMAEIKKDVVDLTRRTVAHEQKNHSLVDLVGRERIEDYFSTRLSNGSNYDRIVRAVLIQLFEGDAFKATALIDAAVKAENSGEGFMKKKSAVLKVAKELGLVKSQANLAIELAVQLTK